MLAFAATHLYGVPPPAPHEELRRTTLTATLIYGGSWFLSGFMVGSFAAITWSAWLAGWLISVLAVPTFRGLARAVCGKRAWWGFPVVVMGAGKVGREVVINLKRRPELGLRPLAILDNDPAKQGTLRVSWGPDDIQLGGVDDDAPPSVAREMGSASRRTAWEHFTEVEGVPILGGFELAPILAQRLGMEIAVIAAPELSSTRVLNIIEAHLDSYSTVLVIPDLFDLSQFGAPSKDLAGMLGIEVQRQLLLRGPRIVKRLMDICLTIVGGVLILPILAMLGVLVALDSPGGVFYRQKRLGQDGVRFEALKFRTMYGDGEARLKEVLAQNPALAAEYDKYHKLTDDPRVTRAGRILRKYSLDELPQIWNVLTGEMSLVGPRPYLPREIPEMSQQECMVLRAKPGITGYWQVTERNSSTFRRRVQMDVEYVRNWSPWLDIYVLARTIPVVIGGTGS
jgi:lipopolysaccharide/colanic/teichoic acid biosynthesis glycosyltransferase